MYGSQKLFMRDSRRLLLFPGGLWMWMVTDTVMVTSWWTLDGYYYFLVDCGW